MGALFRGARCIHISHVCFHIPLSLRSWDILVEGRRGQKETKTNGCVLVCCFLSALTVLCYMFLGLVFGFPSRAKYQHVHLAIIAEEPMNAAMTTHVVMVRKFADCFIVPNCPFARASDASLLCIHASTHPFK